MDVILYTDYPENKFDYEYSKKVKRIIIPRENRESFLEESFENEKPDVFIDNAWGNDTAYTHLEISHRYGVKYYLYIHGLFTSAYSCCTTASMNWHKLYRKCDGILVLSDINEKFYQMCGGYTIRITNPIYDDIVAVEPSPVSKEKVITLIWVGRIDEKKRLDDALKVFNIVANKIDNVRMTILGKWELAESKDIFFSKYLDENNREKVKYVGYVEDVSSYYKEANIVILTSQEEGYCYTILESKAYGLPCVMYDLDYLPLISDRKGVCIVDLFDIEKMAAEVMELAINEKKRIRLSVEARESFDTLSLFDYKEMWKKVLIKMSEEQKSDAQKDNEYVKISNMLLEAYKSGVLWKEERFHNSNEYKYGFYCAKLITVLKNVFNRIKKRKYKEI